MVDWKSPDEILKDSLAFEKLIYSLFGLYVWELFQTCDFEWSIVTRQRKFTWPMSKCIVRSARASVDDILAVFFFLGRYCMLWALIGIIISFNVTTKINCQALYTFNSWTGNMAILCASTSLMIRTIAIWERRLAIVVPLLFLCLGHWGVLYHGSLIVRAEWNDVAGACVVNQSNSAILKFTFFVTMGFDLIILVVTCTALLRNSTRSGLWQLLFRDGLVYWGLSFAGNAVPAILNSLDLNTMMNIIATVPAATVSCIAANRCVVRLQEFTNRDVYVNNSSVGAVLSNEGNGRMGGAMSAVRFGTTGNPMRSARPEVHIRTDHITMETLSKTVVQSPRSSKKSPHDLEGGSTDEDDITEVKVNHEDSTYGASEVSFHHTV